MFYPIIFNVYGYAESIKNIWVKYYTMTEYVNLKLPKDMIELVRKFIEEHPEWGYTSVPEFVKEAIRDYILYLESSKASQSSKEEPSE